MCLSIIANGWEDGKNTHVSVFAHMMKGEFDSHLQWPFKGEITVQLVNQKDRGEHHQYYLVESSDAEEDGYNEVFAM